MGKIKDVSLRSLNKGYEVSFCETTLKMGDGRFPEMGYDYKNEAYSDAKSAFDRFQELDAKDNDEYPDQETKESF
jgi:hypothetical protein